MGQILCTAYTKAKIHWTCNAATDDYCDSCFVGESGAYLGFL